MDLADADLFRPPLGGETGQPEQAQRGDKNGDADKEDEYFAFALVIAEEPVEAGVLETALDRRRRHETMPDAVHSGDPLARLARLYSHGNDAHPVRRIVIREGLGRGSHAVEVRVGDHTDDGHVVDRAPPLNQDGL